MAKRSEDTPQDAAIESTIEAIPDEPEPAPPIAALVDNGGRALYGYARGVTGQKLIDAWNAAPAGLRAPYIERAQIVLDTLS